MEFEGRHIPNNLRKYRRLLGYKQKEVANAMGVDRAAMNRWEKGESFPGIWNLFRLSVIYRTFPTELYEGLFLKAQKEIEDYQAITCKTNNSNRI